MLKIIHGQIDTQILNTEGKILLFKSNRIKHGEGDSTVAVAHYIATGEERQVPFEVVREVVVEKFIDRVIEVIKEIYIDRFIEIEKPVIQYITKIEEKQVETPIEVIKEIIREVHILQPPVEIEKYIIPTKIKLALIISVVLNLALYFLR